MTDSADMEPWCASADALPVTTSARPQLAYSKLHCVIVLDLFYTPPTVLLTATLVLLHSSCQPSSFSQFNIHCFLVLERCSEPLSVQAMYIVPGSTTAAAAAAEFSISNTTEKKQLLVPICISQRKASGAIKRQCMCWCCAGPRRQGCCRVQEEVGYPH